MAAHQRLVAAVVLSILLPSLLYFALFLFYFHLRHRLRRRRGRSTQRSLRPGVQSSLTVFTGFSELTVKTILDAQGEVIATSRHSVLYRATLTASSAGTGDVVKLLRFIQPTCAAPADVVVTACRELSEIQHSNVVPLQAVYIGPRGETLLVHPFYAAGTLRRFLIDGIDMAQRLEIVRKLALGIARGLHHLHTMQPRPIVHGNLKTSNVMLDIGGEPRIADAGMHRLLCAGAAETMLDALASQGCKAPELVIIADASRESDVYSFGVVLLELLAPNGKAEEGASPSSSVDQRIRSPPTTLTTFRDLVLERKISKAFGAEAGMGIGGEIFKLATACCSPSPVMRPDMKQVVTKLEAICTPTSPRCSGR